jgi:hypothetical protein
MDIVPELSISPYRMGTLRNLNKSDIVRILGFEPNVKSDFDKIINNWGFTLDGERCDIWDYDNSDRRNEWSTFGSHQKMKELFGIHYTPLY